MNLMTKVRNTGRYMREDVWDVELSAVSPLRRWLVKLVRVAHLVLKGFRDDQCPLHASALTFSTLMSVVPVLAVSLALATGLGAGDKAEERIKASVREWTEQFRVAERAAAAEEAKAHAASARKRHAEKSGVQVVEKVAEDAPIIESADAHGESLADKINDGVDKIFEFVHKINFAALGGIGLAFLLWTVVAVLGDVESSFNKVWAVKHGRPLHRRLFDYIGVLVVLPILMVAATSMSVADLVAQYVPSAYSEQIRAFLGSGSITKITALAGSTAIFTFLIMFMPNAKVEFKAGICGGLVTAVMFMLWLWVLAWAQVGAVKSLKIYASFAVLPIMLLWVYIGWEIILFGAEVAFGVQNCTTYRMEAKSRGASIRTRIAMALSVVDEAARAMLQNGGGFDVTAFSRRNKIPVRLINGAVEELTKAGVIGKLTGSESCYTLLRSPESFTAKGLIDVILDAGIGRGEVGLNDLGLGIESAMKHMDDGLASELRDIKVKDLSKT